MDIVTEIAPTGFIEQHPELHHYTGWDGLKGIYESRSLWAMQYDQLNDTTEFSAIKEPLVAALGNRFFELLKRLQRDSFRVRLSIKRAGRGVNSEAHYQARRLVEAFYESCMRTPNERAAYLTSFCTHSQDKYAAENGLLSQWRGYGRDEGYCLVFDTGSLIDLLQKEYEAFHWISLQLDPVIYRTAAFSIEQAFQPLLDTSEDYLRGAMKGAEPSPETLCHFLRAVALVKQQGFREENEARIVVWPATAMDGAELSLVHRWTPPPTKPICVLGKRSYVSLFKTLNSSLPIKRVIVGPSDKQAANMAKAKALLGASIPLTCSDIPYATR